LTLLEKSGIDGVLAIAKSWVTAEPKCRSNVDGALCDPCAVGSVAKPLPLRYDSLYCEEPDNKKDYLICFDATPREQRLVCKPGYGWDPLNRKACPNPTRNCEEGEERSVQCGGRCKLTGGWVKQSGEALWPRCLQSARDYQAAHPFPCDPPGSCPSSTPS
jgi:hypothetical protein